jgi:hypothetical protein
MEERMMGEMEEEGKGGRREGEVAVHIQQAESVTGCAVYRAS